MPLTDNLQSYWKLDGDATDATATHNDGTPTDITFSSGNGKIVQGAGFNGSSSKINLGQPTSLNFGTGSFSFSFWVKTISIVDAGLICNRTTGNTGYQILMVSNKLYCDGVGTGGVSSSASINDGNWHFCTVVFDRANSLLRLYVDGSADGTTALGATSATETADALFGEGHTTATVFYTGAIDEVGVWSRALTSGEVTSLYNGGAGLAYPFVVSLSLTLPIANINLLAQSLIPLELLSLTLPTAYINLLSSNFTEKVFNATNWTKVVVAPTTWTAQVRGD